MVPEATLLQRTAVVDELRGELLMLEWREAERFARVAMSEKSTATHRVADLHGFQNARS